jgi:hypothetical protein
MTLFPGTLGSLRRGARGHDFFSTRGTLFVSIAQISLHSDARAGVNNGLAVFIKLWDGWNFSPQDSENEASVYYRQRELWGAIVPQFLGLGNWGFRHILLLSFIEVGTGVWCTVLTLVSESDVISGQV